MGLIQERFIQLVTTKLEAFKTFAEDFGKSRFLVYETEIQAPAEKADAYEREKAEMEAIADAFRCEIHIENNAFTLYFYMDDRNPGHFLEIVDAGMPAPLAGGDEGISQNPDGSTYNSPTPYKHWHDPVPGYAKPATGVINEIRTMLADLFKQEAEEAFRSAKAEIGPTVKQYVSEQLRAAGG